MNKKIFLILLIPLICYGGFYEDAFYNNHWLWFHVGAGAALTIALVKYAKFTPVEAFITVTFTAIVYEFFEYTVNQEAYRNRQHFLYDSVGDIVGATGMSFTVSIML